MYDIFYWVLLILDVCLAGLVLSGVYRNYSYKVSYQLERAEIITTALLSIPLIPAYFYTQRRLFESQGGERDQLSFLHLMEFSAFLMILGGMFIYMLREQRCEPRRSVRERVMCIALGAGMGYAVIGALFFMEFLYMDGNPKTYGPKH